MSVTTEYLKRVISVLKTRFPNLTAEEAVDLAGKILDELPLEDK